MALTAAGLLVGSTTLAQTVDGTRDGSYPAALAVQTTYTGFGDNNVGQPGPANGSELDNVHAQIVNDAGVNYLYLFFGGNIHDFNKLDIFIDSKAGGQNVLRGDNPNVDFDGLNKIRGLKFDAGFTSDYFITIGAGNNPLEVYTNFAQTPTNGGGLGNYAGGGQALVHNVSFGGGPANGIVAVNNSNTAGVDGANVNNPGAVSTGIELRIPLTALGTTVQGGDIRVAAFINGGGHDYLSSQVLGGLPGGTGNLGGDGAGNYIGSPLSVDFTSFAGEQFVTIENDPPAPMPDIVLDPVGPINFFNVGVTAPPATRTIEVSNNGSASLTVTSVTSTNPRFTVNVNNFTLAPGAAQNVVVTFDPTLAVTNSGQIRFASNDPDTPLASVSVSGRGIAAGQVIVDGRLDGVYGSALALQNNTTGYGDNQSELDGAYARIANGNLHLMFTGNLQDNFNRYVLFFDNSPAFNNNYFQASAWPSIGNSDNLDGLYFDPGFSPEYMMSLNMFASVTYADFAQIGTGSSVYLGSASATSQTLNFPSGQQGELAFNNSNTGGVNGTGSGSLGNPAAVTTGFELVIPLTDIAPGYSSAMPLRVVAFVANSDFNNISNQVLGGIGEAGNFNKANLGSPNNVNLGEQPGTQFVTLQRGDVTVADGEFLDLMGQFRRVRVNSGGYLTVYETLDASQSTLIDSEGTLDLGFARGSIIGAGSFSLLGDATLELQDCDGLTTSNSGAIRNTGARLLSSTGSYVYTLEGPGCATGNLLPSTVREVRFRAPALRGGSPFNATLTNNLSVMERVVLDSADLTLGGRTLRLLSDVSTGTAMIVNNGGAVIGSTGQMEIGLDPAFTGLGYRHYSSPVAAQTIGGLANARFTPIVDGAYNTANPPTYTPATFPNVFFFDETKSGTNFVDGYQSPSSLSNTMTVGRGYAVRVSRLPEMLFSGSFNNGDQDVTLTNAGSGWNLIGNPFPSPLDWDEQTDLTGITGAVAVQSPVASPTANGGVYLTRNNGIGSLFQGWIPAAQGFFVECTTPGTFTLEQGARVDNIDGPTLHYRSAPDERPLVELALEGTGNLASMVDRAYVYFEQGATAAQDARFDAPRVAFSTGDAPSISTRLDNGKLAQIDGRPLLTRDTEIALDVRAPRAGTYVISAAALRNFAADQPVYLVDALTNTVQDLRATAEYRFQLDPATTAPRFSLRFGAGEAASASANSLLSVYPNPSAGDITIEWAGTEALSGTVTLTDLLGRVVRELPAGSARLSFDNLPKGVYSLRAQSSEGPLTRRVVVE